MASEHDDDMAAEVHGDATGETNKFEGANEHHEERAAEASGNNSLTT